jgi:hypothetical protein
VAGDEQRDQLVPDLGVGERRAPLVAREHQRREDVRALFEVGRRAALRDLRVENRVDLTAVGLEAPGGVALAEAPAAEEEQGHAGATGDGLEHGAQPPAQLVVEPAGLQPEDRAHDHVERQALHRGQQGEGLSHRPAVDRPVRGLAHGRGVGLHPRAVEGPRHEPALAQVLVAVEQEHRALAQHGSEQRVGLPGMELLVRTLEDLPDQLWLEDHHEPRVEGRAERDGIPVATPAGVEEAPGEEHEGGRLDPPAEGEGRAAARPRGGRR